MITISVDSIPVDGKLPKCFFARTIKRSVLDSISIEQIVTSLHILFVGIPHVVNIKFQF